MMDFDLSFETVIPITIIIIFVLMIALLYISISNRLYIKKIMKKYDKEIITDGNGNVEKLVSECIELVKETKGKNKDIENHINYIERYIIQCVQKVGIIRFNAFENVGSDLSFSVALLDSNDNGVIISGIYSRDSTSTYAKPVVNGNSKYTLSAEEIQAINAAKKTYGERLYKDK